MPLLLILHLIATGAAIGLPGLDEPHAMPASIDLSRSDETEVIQSAFQNAENPLVAATKPPSFSVATVEASPTPTPAVSAKATPQSNTTVESSNETAPSNTTVPVQEEPKEEPKLTVAQKVAMSVEVQTNQSSQMSVQQEKQVKAQMPPLQPMPTLPKPNMPLTSPTPATASNVQMLVQPQGMDTPANVLVPGSSVPGMYMAAPTGMAPPMGINQPMGMYQPMGMIMGMGQGIGQAMMGTFARYQQVPWLHFNQMAQRQVSFSAPGYMTPPPGHKMHLNPWGQQLWGQPGFNAWGQPGMQTVAAI